jgi:hypothetical protein
MTDPDPIRVALQAAAAFERLAIPYVVGGSLASSLIGEPRATYDVDIAADVRPEHVLGLFLELGERFHVDLAALRESVRNERMFQFVHAQEYVKVDVYPRRAVGFHASEYARAERRLVVKDPPQYLRLASAEDTVLQKLVWYRIASGSSDRQWRDVLGVVKVRCPLLDRAYLEKWGRELDVSDLLVRVLAEAGCP